MFFFSEGLNDAGQLAFRATLADGRDVIVRADPVPVPEPSTLTLVGLAALGGLLYRWRRLGRAA
ncbi:MAG TPA: PEP-CTERM sorting domain-containing protein [Gemmataceae bacterium]|nr:PEP-CTERM sorting domain-containing protein [Gemmataceae bacterium]